MSPGLKPTALPPETDAARLARLQKKHRPVFDASRVMDLRPIPLRGDWLRLQRQIMELPILALTESRGIFRWANTPGVVGKWGLDADILWVEVTPSGKGSATVDDGDILMFLHSKIMAGAMRRVPAGYEVLFSGSELLRATGVGGGGSGYSQIEHRLDRLQGTQVKTCARAGNATCKESFTLIGPWRSVAPRGRNAHYAVTLPQWTVDALQHGEVLSLGDPARYFKLRPLEKRLFQLFRKHLGAKRRWAMRLDTLYEKTGVNCTKKKFVEQLKRVIATGGLPGLALSCDFKAPSSDRIVVASARPGGKPKAAVTPKNTVIPGTNTVIPRTQNRHSGDLKPSVQGPDTVILGTASGASAPA